VILDVKPLNPQLNPIEFARDIQTYKQEMPNSNLRHSTKEILEEALRVLYKDHSQFSVLVDDNSDWERSSLISSWALFQKRGQYDFESLTLLASLLGVILLKSDMPPRAIKEALPENQFYDLCDYDQELDQLISFIKKLQVQLYADRLIPQTSRSLSVVFDIAPHHLTSRLMFQSKLATNGVITTPQTENKIELALKLMREVIVYVGAYRKLKQPSLSWAEISELNPDLKKQLESQISETDQLINKSYVDQYYNLALFGCSKTQLTPELAVFAFIKKHLFELVYHLPKY
jgi:hypothetical protein